MCAALLLSLTSWPAELCHPGETGCNGEGIRQAAGEEAAMCCLGGSIMSCSRVAAFLERKTVLQRHAPLFPVAFAASSMKCRGKLLPPQGLCSIQHEASGVLGTFGGLSACTSMCLHWCSHWCMCSMTLLCAARTGLPCLGHEGCMACAFCGARVCGCNVLDDPPRREHCGEHVCVCVSLWVRVCVVCVCVCVCVCAAFCTQC